LTLDLDENLLILCRGATTLRVGLTCVW